MNSLHPDPSAVHSTHVPHDGGGYLAHLLREALPSPWEIYEQPFLNGDYPAVAALHPSAGLTIFDVHDWDLRNYRREQIGRYQRYTQRAEQKTRAVLNPVRRAEHYIENLLNLYAPFIGESVMRDRRTLSAFRVGVYFPNANSNAVRSFCPLAPGRGIVFGRDALDTGDLSLILPLSVRPGSTSLPDDWLAALRFWLAPPLHGAAKEPWDLTVAQRHYILPAPGQHQFLSGVAGSGKTLVLAQRAAQLAALGKRVLVVTANVTLWQYIRQLVSQTAFSFPWTQLEFHHFYGFCKNFLIENSIEWPLSNNRRSRQILDEMMPELVVDALQAGHNSKGRQYDAILIDEGQDFPQSYYAMLCHFLSANDELLLVSDPRQNLSQRDDSWLEQTPHLQFQGSTPQLETSFRLPALIAEEANRFAHTFLPEIAAAAIAGSPSQRQPAQLHWHNITSLEQATTLVGDTVQQLMATGVKPADIVVLTPNQQDGWALVRYLTRQEWEVNHVLAEDDGQLGRKRERYRKRAFAEGDPRLKVSTIHGFRGWELDHVILLTAAEEGDNPRQSHSLFYLAITRARQSLWVLNRTSVYQDYGDGWARHAALAEAAASHPLP
ncbi:MAG: ATP-binding domain-containing protein [Caldilineaceae bacterium]|nr:ATP-binding domain-containing protein [Caldilineaceae bacterium]